MENTTWTGIVFENPENSYSLEKMSFENCGIEGVANYLYLENSDFTNGGI